VDIQEPVVPQVQELADIQEPAVPQVQELAGILELVVPQALVEAVAIAGSRVQEAVDIQELQGQRAVVDILE
jgi:hypothetical protein